MHKARDLYRLAATCLLILLLGAKTGPVTAQSETPLPNPQVVISTNYGNITVRLYRVFSLSS